MSASTHLPKHDLQRELSIQPTEHTGRVGGIGPSKSRPVREEAYVVTPAEYVIRPMCDHEGAAEWMPFLTKSRKIVKQSFCP